VKKQTSSWLGTLILTVAIVALAAVFLVLLGARFGLWEPIVGFGLIRSYLNPLGYGVIALAVCGAIMLLVQRRAGFVKSLLASLIGLGLLTPMIKDRLSPPPRFPPIHDITTDTANVPAFMVLDDNRAGARNTLEYGGAEVAAQQLQAFPDITPIQSHQSATASYIRSLEVARAMGWQIVAEDAQGLRFEATARTPVFQFVDDVVVVVTALADEASRVDIRSVSRIGRGDRGVNAARVRAFTEAF